METDDKFTINLVGAGNMGGAMLQGWIAGGVGADRITVIDPAPSVAMSGKLGELGVRLVGDAGETTPADILLLAVKPQIMGAVLPKVAALCGNGTVTVSVAAGPTIAQLEAGLGGRAAVVRAMPNTPALIGQGMTVACANSRVEAVGKARVDWLLAATGRCEWVADEGLIDAVTAVSGSGPAYVFHLAECMAAAGMKAGLGEELAMILARETVAGAGALLAASAETPARLRENVTSPNGTTAAALSVLMENDAMARLFEDAIGAARQRSVELSK